MLQLPFLPDRSVDDWLAVDDLVDGVAEQLRGVGLGAGPEGGGGKKKEEEEEGEEEVLSNDGDAGGEVMSAAKMWEACGGKASDFEELEELD
jgi:hypothetical protein